MASHRLPNYLRTHRKRAGLSQDEVSHIVGASGGPKVSRYERGSRRPSLETALAYEAVFGVPVRELFAGVYDEVERHTQRRAIVLANRLRRSSTNARTARKLAAMNVVSGSGSSPEADEGYVS